MSANIDNFRSYDTLCNVLDSLRSEAPPTDVNYHVPITNNDMLVNARSKALLHLFLKAKFGLLSFTQREYYVTDGKYDGGIDAYYIHENSKIIYIVQSKFRANAKNFVKEKIDINDLLKIDAKRILTGHKVHEDKTPYNKKIIQLQKDINNLSNRAEFKIKIVLLGNAEHIKESSLKKIIDGYEVEQFPHARTYKELLFPVINGTYFNEPNLSIEINLRDSKRDSHLEYDAKSKTVQTNIKLLFVPTLEIGRIMSTYRNSILKYNPRSFLELTKNPVNKEIEKSIIANNDNEFALFNNGITIITSRTQITSDTGKKYKAQAILQNPQLINGGQTAYTLGRIYENCKKKDNFSVFKNKEVLVKIISFLGSSNKSTKSIQDSLISEISKASNSQTKIEEADRRSNDKIQLELQSEFFDKYGLYYERKLGEFSDGLKDGYITQNLILKRDLLIAVALCVDYKPNQARASKAKFFTKSNFDKVLNIKDIEKYAFGYEILRHIDNKRKEKPLSKTDRYKTKQFGQALRYGQYSVVSVCINQLMKMKPIDAMNQALSKWNDFEKVVTAKSTNKHYFSDNNKDFDNYYKGSTLSEDLKKFSFGT